ncbi:MAG: 50S ribosomal protein L11 [Candidatus Diapherotrites archaeon]|nr:50S ribosomal protein L11 [Candidatus Diapherotrites archaeon]
MPESIISVLVDGGKASAGPPLGPALGPTGINVGEVVKEINEKTKDYAGIQVPVEVIIDSTSKSFKIKVGSPPVSALIKKETGLDKLEGVDLPIGYVIKVAEMKRDYMLAKDKKKAIKEVLGTCQSMGLKVDGKPPKDVQKEVDEGKYDAKIEGKEELTFLSPEEIAKIKEKIAREAKQREEKKEEAKEEAAEETPKK